MKAKNYTKEEILNSALLGLEFEFYSKLKDTDISRGIGKMLGKRVVIPLSVSAVGEKPKPLYHSPIAVTDKIFKLEPDFSGGEGMYELVTGPMPLPEARKLLIKVLDWIDQYGYTNDRCSIHANLSFDYGKIEPTLEIENLEVLKFVLSFDEGPVYKAFPTREHSVYARTIQSIIPNSFFFYDSVPSDFAVMNNLLVPEEKYFGINFTKREKGYLEFRYMGGKDYEKKPKKILDTIDHFGLSFFNVINNPEYTKEERDKLKKIFKKHAKIVDSFSDYEKFMKDFKDIEVSVDLNKDPQVVKTFWIRIRERIFDLMVNSGFKKGRVNLDTDFGRIQLAGAELKDARIKSMDLVDCKIEGVINHCSLYFCEIANSRVKDCEAMKDNKFIGSKVEEVVLHATNTCDNCFINNAGTSINCKVNGGVIRKGEIGAMAEISDETSIVEQMDGAQTMEAPKKYEDKTKDFRWIKELAKKYNNKK